VVIGMSSKMSYWDVRYSQDFLLARRIVRAFFALCKRIYLNFSLERFLKYQFFRGLLPHGFS